MKNRKQYITVFEHQTLKLNQVIDGVEFDNHSLRALQEYYGQDGVPYFNLIHKGVRFNEYVGVIQVGGTIIEVLPKADNNLFGKDEKNHWRDVLIDMLFAVGVFDIHAPSVSSLKLKNNSILDLYFELFIREIEFLLHTGLSKQYRKKEGNTYALKGNLNFSKHIQQNLTHQERFYVRYTTYDVEHKIHSILYKTIRLLKQINTNSSLQSRIGAVLLHFPEMSDIIVTTATFERLVLNRKTQSYKKALEISKLLLLKYHPDVSNGKDNVLALMFDMNKLWEQFVYVSLRKQKEINTTISAQTTKYFWKPEIGNHSKIIPDIWIKRGDNNYILDTKWKNLNGNNPSPEDLRQMYVYLEYYNAIKVALVYPGSTSKNTNGHYLDPETKKPINKECSVVSLSVNRNVKLWQQGIRDHFENWFKL